MRFAPKVVSLGKKAQNVVFVLADRKNTFIGGKAAAVVVVVVIVVHTYVCTFDYISSKVCT